MFLAVSWETGYRNIQVFHEGRLVHTINQPGVLVDGIKIVDEKLGKLKFVFSTERPRKLEIKVNNRKFKTVNKLDMGYEYGGLVAIFTTLAIFAAIETMIFGGLYDFDFAYLEFTGLFIINAAIVALYIVTSILLSKKKPWAYFIGGSMFLLTTLISTLGFSLIFVSFINIVLLVLRYGILIYIFLQGKHILKELKKSKNLGPKNDLSNDLLDNL